MGKSTTQSGAHSWVNNPRSWPSLTRSAPKASDTTCAGECAPKQDITVGGINPAHQIKDDLIRHELQNRTL
jgi:hypothetical protein